MDIESIAKTLPHSTRAPGVVPPSNAIDYINNMDMSKIEEKLQKKDPLVSVEWSEQEVCQAIRYYKNFLILNVKYGDQKKIIPPSLEMDEIWHHHILDTRKYITDCNNIFGYYFHHYPYFGTRGEDDKKALDLTFNITQELHLEEFGEYIYEIKNSFYE